MERSTWRSGSRAGPAREAGAQASSESRAAAPGEESGRAPRRAKPTRGQEERREGEEEAVDHGPRASSSRNARIASVP